MPPALARRATRFAAVGFKGDSKTARAVGANAASACFDCHTAQKVRQYVFSAWRP